MGFKETRAYLEKCISRSALVCPFGFAAGRNKLCVCVMQFTREVRRSATKRDHTTPAVIIEVESHEIQRMSVVL